MVVRTILAISFFLGLFLAIPAFAQEPQEKAPAYNDAKENIEWVWGEVVAVKKDAKEIVVKYTDYETDAEKQISVVISKDTEFENAKSLEEIKTGDYLSVDYEVKNGKNTAIFIIVEKEENAVTGEEEN